MLKIFSCAEDARTGAKYVVYLFTGTKRAKRVLVLLMKSK